MQPEPKRRGRHTICLPSAARLDLRRGRGGGVAEDSDGVVQRHAVEGGGPDAVGRLRIPLEALSARVPRV